MKTYNVLYNSLENFKHTYTASIEHQLMHSKSEQCQQCQRHDAHRDKVCVNFQELSIYFL